jgi:hypothetical protein
MFECFKKRNIHEDMRIFINQMNKISQKEMECNTLYQALFDCCKELYKHTGNIKECNPEFFINKVKNRYE